VRSPIAVQVVSKWWMTKWVPTITRDLETPSLTSKFPLLGEFRLHTVAW
jgi:hypothetical protein